MNHEIPYLRYCLLYTSDAADDSLRVDLGGRRIIKKNVLKARKLVIRGTSIAGSGHPGGSFSMAEIMGCIFYNDTATTEIYT